MTLVELVVQLLDADAALSLTGGIQAVCKGDVGQQVDGLVQ